MTWPAIGHNITNLFIVTPLAERALCCLEQPHDDTKTPVKAACKPRMVSGRGKIQRSKKTWVEAVAVLPGQVALCAPGVAQGAQLLQTLHEHQISPVTTPLLFASNLARPLQAVLEAHTACDGMDFHIQ